MKLQHNEWGDDPPGDDNVTDGYFKPPEDGRFIQRGHVTFTTSLSMRPAYWLGEADRRFIAEPSQDRIDGPRSKRPPVKKTLEELKERYRKKWGDVLRRLGAS